MDCAARLPAEALIEETRAGRICVLMHEDEAGVRGELFVPADAADAEAINFMARHGRGLISLALTRARVEQLRLPPMSAFGSTKRKVAFTVSIEARTGVTTGISAADRARTVAVAIDPALGSDALVTPGHVFPLVAQDAGVLARPGFTEAAVDLARLAGRNPSGVICQVIDDAGELADASALAELSIRHGLVLGRIADLTEHLRSTEALITRTGECLLDGGPWRGVLYAGRAGEEHLALVLGEVMGGLVSPPPVHLHDVSTPRAVADLHRAMQAAETEGRGVVILLGASGLLLERLRQSASRLPGLRDRAIAAQIMADLTSGA